MHTYTLGTWPFRPSQSSMHVYGKMFSGAGNLLRSGRAWASQIRTCKEKKNLPGGAGWCRAARALLARNSYSLGGRWGGARRTRGAKKIARGVQSQRQLMGWPESPAPVDTGTIKRLSLAWMWAREVKNENVWLARSLALARSAKRSRSRRKHARARGRMGRLT